MTQGPRSSRYISLADTPCRSRGLIHPSFASSLAPQSKRAQGRPGAGSHPRSAARNAHAGRTAQQHTGGADHSAFPARWSDGLCRDLPGAELSFGLPRRSNWDDAVHPVGLARIFERLDRSNDGQDHTVLPYARPAMSPQYFQPCRRSRKLTGETKPSSAVRLHAATDSQGLPALPAPLMPTLPRPPQARLAIKTTSRSPLLVSRDERHIRQNRISVKRNILRGGVDGVEGVLPDGLTKAVLVHHGTATETCVLTSVSTSVAAFEIPSQPT